MNSLIKLSNPLPIAILSLGLVSHLGSVANAATFTRVLQTGQAVPGNAQPVTNIRSIAIDNQQNIVAIVSTPTIILNPTRGPQTFQGLYVFNSALVPTLADTAESFPFASDGQSAQFLTASINAGTVITLRNSRLESRPQRDFGQSEVKVGKPGALRTFLTVNRFNLLPRVSISTLALSNGAAFLLGESSPQPPASSQKGLLKSVAPNNLTEVIATTDPVFGTEPFTLTSRGEFVRASGKNILLVIEDNNRYRVFKKSGTAAPQQIDSVTGSFSCGAAISSNNIVVCARDFRTQTGTNLYSLRVKFGNTAPFQSIAFPNTTAIEQPSIAGRTVIFKTATPTQDKLYVSTNAKAPIQILGTGDTLDGKTVSKLSLSEQGQSIARTTDQAQNSSLTIVFIATFTDGTTGLYRGTL